MDTPLSEKIKLAPAQWPEGKPKTGEPGDLRFFVPHGLGLGGPLIMMPHDTLDDMLKRPSFYGFTEPSTNPLKNAPVNDERGGVVYLSGRVTREEIQSLATMMGAWGPWKEYAAFWSKSENVMEDRYVEQLRIVAKGAVEGLFGASTLNEGAELTKQTLSVDEALWAFVESQRKRYEEDSWALQGLMGGDGDWAKERLAFGMMVENAYWGVCRIWSRAWLITK
jgi:hypothetical protein